MRIGIIFVFVDYHRKGRHHRGVLQPQIGPLIAALLPDNVEIEVINDTWEDPDWGKHYDLLFISGMHSDFDRARQISHYWRRRGAKTVYGGTMASTYPHLCLPFFDAVVIGDPENSVPKVFSDFCAGRLEPLYSGARYDAGRVPAPRLDIVARKQVLPLGIEATRGCPFSCEFCALTGTGTRYHVRPTENVARDIRAGQDMLRSHVNPMRLGLVVFYDNNIGGNPQYLRQLCLSLEPLNIRWGSSITFNAISNPDLVRAMSRSGCRFLYVGLESFNSETLKDMHKYHNAIHKTRQMIDECHAQGILVMSGLMLSPLVDDIDYLESIPSRLRDCGLYVPSYVCFETPIPGTPHFHRLAALPEAALLPNALLRDFNTYTLVVRPRKASITDFIDGYKSLIDTVYSPRNRLSKLIHDIPRFLRHSWFLPALLDAADQFQESYRSDPDRTYVAGTDREPPESMRVPLTAGDFDSEDQWQAIMKPWRVSDEQGHVLPEWLNSHRVYEAKGRIAQRIAAAPPFRAAADSFEGAVWARPAA